MVVWMGYFKEKNDPQEVLNSKIKFCCLAKDYKIQKFKRGN